MLSKETIQLFAFIVGITVSAMSVHMGLVRIDANGVDRERPGVLIVVQFGGIVLLSVLGTLALSFAGGFSDPDDVFRHSWIVPLLIFVAVIIDAFKEKSAQTRHRRPPDRYYTAVFVFVAICSLIILLIPLVHPKTLSDTAQFFLSITLCVFIVFSQLLKSALRLAGYVA